MVATSLFIVYAQAVRAAYDISQSVIATGGGTSVNGVLAVTGTITASVTAVFAPNSIYSSRLDIDENGSYDALTDGLLAIRYLFGLTGSALTAGAVGAGAALNDPLQVQQHLDDIKPLLDIDGNGQADALTDGLMLIRYLFGLRGDSLIGSTIGTGATRTTAAQIEGYIQSLLP